MVSTISYIGVGLQTVTCTSLGDKLQHEVVVAIVHASQSRQIALLVVCLHLINDIRGQVLHHRIIVARHEVTSVELEFLHILAVDGDLAIIIDFGTWQRFHKCFYHRAFWHTERIGVVNDGIVLNHHLRDIGCHHGLFQLHGIRFHLQATGVERTVRLFCEAPYDRLVT